MFTLVALVPTHTTIILLPTSPVNSCHRLSVPYPMCLDKRCFSFLDFGIFAHCQLNITNPPTTQNPKLLATGDTQLIFLRFSSTVPGPQSIGGYVRWEDRELTSLQSLLYHTKFNTQSCIFHKINPMGKNPEFKSWFTDILPVVLSNSSEII